jgi:hypothetical protein
VSKEQLRGNRSVTITRLYMAAYSPRRSLEFQLKTCEGLSISVAYYELLEPRLL